MIIACPACATRYVVPESAVGVDGRTVRCAKCRHSWFQDGPSLDEIKPDDFGQKQSSDSVAQDQPTGESEPVPTPDPAEDTESAPPAPESIAAANASAHEEQGAADGNKGRAPYPEPPGARVSPAITQPVHEEAGSDVSRFDYEPPFRPRRNPLKIWTAVGALFAVIVFGTIAAVSYWGLPDWVPVSRPTFAVEQPDLVLDFPADQQDRRTLPNGTEFFGASGTVTNVGSATRSVPSILIVMRDGRDRIVYSWEVVPPQASLDPGETLRINEAVTDVPKSARFAEIGWKPT